MARRACRDAGAAVRETETVEMVVPCWRRIGEEFLHLSKSGAGPSFGV